VIKEGVELAEHSLDGVDGAAEAEYLADGQVCRELFTGVNVVDNVLVFIGYWL
jgi:hypothetical protein